MVAVHFMGCKFFKFNSSFIAYVIIFQMSRTKLHQLSKRHVSTYIEMSASISQLTIKYLYPKLQIFLSFLEEKAAVYILF